MCVSFCALTLYAVARSHSVYCVQFSIWESELALTLNSCCAQDRSRNFKFADRSKTGALSYEELRIAVAKYLVDGKPQSHGHPGHMLPPVEGAAHSVALVALLCLGLFECVLSAPVLSSCSSAQPSIMQVNHSVHVSPTADRSILALHAACLRCH